MVRDAGKGAYRSLSDDELEQHKNGTQTPLLADNEQEEINRNQEYQIRDESSERRSARTDARAKNILNGYLKGQLANVAKFGIWWAMLSPLVLALFNGNAISIGITRVCFNFAMFLLSPLAGFLIENVPVKRVLNLTTFMRAFLYIIVIPGLWVLLRSGWVIPVEEQFKWVFLGTFMSCIFLDGVCVAFSNVVDIDCGGTQLLADQHDIYVDDYTRGRYNSIHIAFFDGSTISLCPLVALLGVLIAEYTPIPDLVGVQNSDIVILLTLVASVFFILSMYSAFSYNCNIPSIPSSKTQNSGGLSFSDIGLILEQLYEGMQLCFRHSQIAWRVVFLAMETAFEDVVISLIISEFALKGITSQENYVLTNLWANFIVAAAKVGAVVAIIMMQKHWKNLSLVPNHINISEQEVAQVMTEFSSISPDAAKAVKRLSTLSLFELRSVPAYAYLTQYEKSILDRERERVFVLRQHSEAYRPLFLYVLVSSLGIMLIPVGLLIRDTYDYAESAIALGFLGAILYMSFASAPKIGFSSLLQNLVSDVNSSEKIYAFTATFLTICDSVIVMGMSALFQFLDFQLSLFICCGVMCFHGLFQYLFGPRLILRPYQFNYSKLAATS